MKLKAATEINHTTSRAIEPTIRHSRVPIVDVRKPGAITIVRSRMLYARAALNAKGGVRFGMRHIRRLTRAPWHLTTAYMKCRRSKPFYGSKQRTTDGAYHALHLSTSIWYTQCLHIQGRYARNGHAIQGLHTTRERDTTTDVSIDLEQYAFSSRDC